MSLNFTNLFWIYASRYWCSNVCFMQQCSFYKAFCRHNLHCTFTQRRLIEKWLTMSQVNWMVTSIVLTYLVGLMLRQRLFLCSIYLHWLIELQGTRKSWHHPETINRPHCSYPDKPSHASTCWHCARNLRLPSSIPLMLYTKEHYGYCPLGAASVIVSETRLPRDQN